MEIDTLKKLCSASKIKWTKHGLERMQERNISIADVKNCIMNGEIIEEYPNDFPITSMLVFGHNVEGRVLHTVCGTDGQFLYVVTAYFPDTDKFESDLKTRRTK